MKLLKRLSCTAWVLGASLLIHCLTVLGLVRASGDSKVIFNGPKAVEVYRELFPLIFGKWEFFKSEGLYLDIVGAFNRACGEEVSSVEYMMEIIDTDYKKEAEEHIRISLQEAEFYNTYLRDEAKELVEVLLDLEFEKKILALSDEEYDRYKKERIKEIQETYQNGNAVSKIVNKVTRKTLFPYEWGFIRKLGLLRGVKPRYDAFVPIYTILAKDKDLQELISNYIEEEIKINKAHLETLEDLKEIWRRLGGV